MRGRLLLHHALTKEGEAFALVTLFERVHLFDGAELVDAFGEIHPRPDSTGQLPDREESAARMLGIEVLAPLAVERIHLLDRAKFSNRHANPSRRTVRAGCTRRFCLCSESYFSSC